MDFDPVQESCATGLGGGGGGQAMSAPGIIGHGIGLAAPAYAAPAYAAPAYATHLAGPVVKAAVAAPALVHTSVSGHGIHYGY
ncbi:GM22898 [Drosophila sechellia]|uniref:GM22898 n=1 Tax=Drosophila sechellia TaxID=7238 RepID=B4I6S1_DROSE|nr:GM22898 [Drosophila sechellia]